MKIFLITLGAIGLFLVLMSVGVIFGNIRIKGSCGGIGKVMGTCGKCDCKKKKELT
jgi:hypothetical protein